MGQPDFSRDEIGHRKLVEWLLEVPGSRSQAE